MLTISFFDGTVVEIEDGVLATFHSYEQRQIWDKEAGGVIVGKKVANEEHYVFSAVSTPSNRDRRTRFSFVRNKQTAQRFINNCWYESAGVENYIGEWHTHPEEKPMPSAIDKSLIRQIVLDKSSPFSKVFLVIVGQKDTLYIGAADSAGGGTIYMSEEIEVNYEHI